MKFFKSFLYAFNGIKICFASEFNFRFHVVAALVAIGLGFFFKISATEWFAIIFCIGFVLSLEMLNTALEKICDMLTQELHPQIKFIKDVAAGAVLVSAISSFIIGGIIFLPKILVYFKI